jgi:hypothetical protein
MLGIAREPGEIQVDQAQHDLRRVPSVSDHRAATASKARLARRNRAGGG